MKTKLKLLLSLPFILLFFEACKPDEKCVDGNNYKYCTVVTAHLVGLHVSKPIQPHQSSVRSSSKLNLTANSEQRTASSH